MSANTDLSDFGKVNLAAECYVRCGEEILLFRRSENKGRFPGYLIGPGGAIDSDEDPAVAAVREVAEETGVKLDTKDLKLRIVTTHKHLDRQELWLSFVFVVDIEEKQTAATPAEYSDEGEAVWVPIDSLTSEPKLFPPVKHYLTEILAEESGIIFSNISWRNAELVKTNSVTKLSK